MVGPAAREHCSINVRNPKSEIHFGFRISGFGFAALTGGAIKMIKICVVDSPGKTVKNWAGT